MLTRTGRSELLAELARRWTWVALGALVAAALAGLVAILQPRAYAASIEVMPKRARTEVTYDTRIRTLSPDSQIHGGLFNPGLSGISPERRQTLAQLVRNADIERTVRTELGERLPAGLRRPGGLLRLVEGRVVPRSEIVLIQVSAPTAELAEEIATTWARAYERHVNQLLVSSIVGSQKLDADLLAARGRNEGAEAVLSRFLATSALGANSRVLNAKRQMAQDLIAIQQASTINLQRVAERVDLFVREAEALQQQLAQVQDGSGVATTSVAVTLLKAQAFASSIGLPANLQLQVGSSGQTGARTTQQGGTTPNNATPPVSGPTNETLPFEGERQDVVAAARALQDWVLPGNLQLQVPMAATVPTLQQQRGDVAATVGALREWRIRLDEEIRTRAADPVGVAVVPGGASSHIGQMISQLEADVRELQGRVAEETARHRNLQLERDVAWDGYASLARKSEEARVASAVGVGNEVSVASETVVASEASRQLRFVLPLAAVTGALLGACLITGRYYVAGASPVVPPASGNAIERDGSGKPLPRVDAFPAR